jgi:REP element-mobilizing transposase RayT
MPELKTRKMNRRKGYDYSRCGKYFITICVQNGECILSDISFGDNGKAILSLTGLGMIVSEHIEKLNNIHNSLKMEAFVIMPNHIHMLIAIDYGNTDTNDRVSIPHLINQWKGNITRQAGFSIWQRSYHDHIIWSKDEYERIFNYINNNPDNWLRDCYFLKK